MPESRSPSNLSWPFSGGDVSDIGEQGRFVSAPLAPAGPDELIARVDCVCICSSDIKIIRMGSAHALFRNRDLAAAPMVLGHELAVTLVEVGENWHGRYRPGQRIGLQPAVFVDGQRRTIGFDLPGGLSQYIRLDPTLLDGDLEPYLFDAPAGVSAAAIALLEPYACVEAAFRPNSRTGLKPGGRVLIVGGEDAADFTLSAEAAHAEAVLVDAPPALEDWARARAGAVTAAAQMPEGAEQFDDIILCGRHDAATIAAAIALLRKGGLLVLAAREPDPEPVDVDVARIHYHEVGIVGTRGPRVDDAFGPERNRFEVKRGGTTLVLGAGGAMGRIHTHRALELDGGPARLIVTSRKGDRLDGLRRDFSGLAEAHGRDFHVLEDATALADLEALSPGGVDDAVVVAPDVSAIERSAAALAPGGMLVIFAGIPLGQTCRLPLSRIVTDGLRITGSTGCTVADQLGVLERLLRGELDPTENLEAVAGFESVPEAFAAVMQGRVNGKVAIYPGIVGLTLTRVETLRDGGESTGHWTLEDERALAERAREPAASVAGRRGG